MEKKTCFVITPIGQKNGTERRRADRLCDQILAPALREFNLDIQRGDRLQEQGPISVQIIESITDSSLIVADLVDPNPNVYYELGIAESFHKPIIRFGGASAEALPFDVRDMRTLNLPKTRDGSIDVVHANKCISSVKELAKHMLADDFKPNSIISRAKREAQLESFLSLSLTEESADISKVVMALFHEVKSLSNEVKTHGVLNSTTVKEILSNGDYKKYTDLLKNNVDQKEAYVNGNLVVTLTCSSVAYGRDEVGEAFDSAIKAKELLESYGIKVVAPYR